MKRIPLAKTFDIPVGQAKDIAWKGQKIIIINAGGGTFRAFYNVCTHSGGPVCLLGGVVLKCSHHGARFDPVTGEAKTGPAPMGSKLRTAPLEITDGVIYLLEEESDGL